MRFAIRRIECIGLCSIAIWLMGCGTKGEVDMTMSVPTEIEEEVVTTAPISESIDKHEKQADTQKSEQKLSEMMSANQEEETKRIFSALSQNSFIFCSGAGAWSESFNIEKDGSFYGSYIDSDMGDTGEGYENGTRYVSNYNGHFTDLVKLDEYTYQIRLKDITYDNEPDKEEIIDNIRTIYTASCCLSGEDNDLFTIYLPGKNVSEIPEEVNRWYMNSALEQAPALQNIAMADLKNNIGMYSVPGTTPLD